MIMKLTQLGPECPDGNTCPAVFTTDEGTVVVQGRRVSQSTLSMLTLGAEEDAVEIPLALLREVAGQC
jgi:hypothetical protein